MVLDRHRNDFPFGNDRCNSAIDFIIRSIFRQEIPTLQGGTIKPKFFRVGDNEPDLQDPYLFWPINIRASNGFIHTINRVLIPLDI